MLSAILILALSVTAIALAWSLLIRGSQQAVGIRPAFQDHDDTENLDLRILRVLLDPNEFHYLRRALARKDFHNLLRQRIGLTFTMLGLLEDKINRTLEVERLAAAKSNRELAASADALLASTVQLRFNLLLARVCLSVQWLFPYGTSSLPYWIRPYQHLLNSLERRAVLTPI